MYLKQKQAERNKETLRKLSQREDNKFCFDCGARGPLYVVINYHIMVCSTCAAVHRSLQHKVKGISMSEFTQDEMTGIATGGNARARSIWLARYPGQLPRSGNDRAIRTFVMDTFQGSQYLDRRELERFDADMHNALHPPPLPSPPVPLQAPPPAEPRAPPPQSTAKAPANINLLETSSPAPPPATQDDIFDDFFAAPPAPSANGAAAPPAPCTAEDLFASLPPPSAAPPPPAWQPAPQAATDFFGSMPPQPQQQQVPGYPLGLSPSPYGVQAPAMAPAPYATQGSQGYAQPMYAGGYPPVTSSASMQSRITVLAVHSNTAPEQGFTPAGGPEGYFSFGAPPDPSAAVSEPPQPSPQAVQQSQHDAAVFAALDPFGGRP